ncbi:MAG: polysaccharide deacetylase family protein [Oscillospiraceae bacterium]|nr:polysaccharide deacetylase family protein [Oscillospiraceae bacterium]
MKNARQISVIIFALLVLLQSLIAPILLTSDASAREPIPQADIESEAPSYPIAEASFVAELPQTEEPPAKEPPRPQEPPPREEPPIAEEPPAQYIDLEYAYTLFDDIGGVQNGTVGPEEVRLLYQIDDWVHIDTAYGPGWLYMPPPPPPRVALTFDDGPSTHTRRLLTALASRRVTATFFVVGWRVTENPEIAARIVEDGHEIASHTYYHPLLTRISANHFRGELTRTHNAILAATGAEPAPIFRPPYGIHNRMARNVAAEFGLPLILWSVDTRDWETRTVEGIMSHIVDGDGNLRIRDGDIILMHDVFGTTVDGALRLIDLLLEEGFVFVHVSELLESQYGTLQPGAVYGRR